MNLRCPFADWVPWRYRSESMLATYYRGLNNPEAVVLHIAQGYARTARQWAEEGHYGASWHFTVGRDGSIMQHLEPQDGGYHAGITDAVALIRPPTWPLWKGKGINVNHYTVGIEHEGFVDDGYPWPEAQRAASKRLCRWIADDWGIPYDREHFPAHAEIDIRDRFNDFAAPEDREAHYRYLFEEDDMTPAEVQALIDEALAKQEAEFVAAVGSTPIRNAQALTKRMFAIHDVTDPAKIPGE